MILVVCVDWCYGVNVMKAVNVKIDFCMECNKRHSAPWFRGPKGSRVCSKMYQKLARQARNAKKVLKKRKGHQHLYLGLRRGVPR